MPDLEVRFLLSRSSGYKQADPHRAISLLHRSNHQVNSGISTRTTDNNVSRSLIAIVFRFQNP